MTRSVFCICQTKCPKPHFMDTPGAPGQQGTCDSQTLLVLALHAGGLDELMSVLQRSDRLGVSELSPLARSLEVFAGGRA